MPPRPPLRHARQCLYAVLGGAVGDALCPERHAEDVPHIWVIVHHQHVAHALLPTRNVSLAPAAFSMHQVQAPAQPPPGVGAVPSK